MKPVAKKSQKTVKFPADIARAWGCRVYEPRMTGKLKRQLAPVVAAMAREDFPKAVKGRRQRDEIVAWGSAFVTLSKDKRKITVHDFTEKAAKEAEDTAAANAAGDGDLFLNEEALTDAIIKELRL